MGNEMGNQNISGTQEKNSIKLEAPSESMEATVASINANSIEDANQQVSFPKENFHEYNTGFASEGSFRTDDPIEQQTLDTVFASEDSFRTDDPIEEQTLDGREQDETETQAPEGSPKASVDSKHNNDRDGVIQLVSSPEDGKFHQKIGSPTVESLSRTMDNQIQRQASSQKEEEETRNASLDTKFMVCRPTSMEVHTLKSDQHESTIADMNLAVSPYKDKTTNEHTGSSSVEKLCRTNENQTQSQASIRGGEETMNPSLDSKSLVPNSNSVEAETVNSEQHTSNTSHAEPLVSSSENGKSNEHTASPPKDNSSRTNDNQIQRETSIEGEEEEARNSSLNTKSIIHNPKSVELENLKSDLQESTKAHTQLFVEASIKLPEISGDIPKSSGPLDSKEKGHKLKDEAADSLHGSYILPSFSEVENIGKDMPIENMETQEVEVVDTNNINVVESEIIRQIEAEDRCRTTPTPEVENRGGEVPTLSNSLGNDGRDCMDSQSEAVVLTRLPDSFQIEASEPECKYIVLTNDSKVMENGSESEQNGYDSNTTFLSEELVEHSNADEKDIFQTEHVMIGTDHGGKRKGSELCDSYKPKIQSDFQIDDANVSVDVFKLNMHDSNRSLVSEEPCEKLEGETKMVVVVETVPTELILIDGNHEERELITCSSPSLDPTKHKVTIEEMKKAEDADSNLSPLHPIESVENFLPPDPVSLGQPKDPKQGRLMESETVDSGSGSNMESNQNCNDEVDINKTSKFNTTNSTIEKSLENETSRQDWSQHQGLDQSQHQEFTTVTLVPSDITVDGSEGQESTCDVTNHACDIDLRSVSGTQENNGFINETNQGNIKANVDVRAESNFELHTPRKESEAPAATQLDKKFCAKGQVSAFTSCVLDALETDLMPEFENHAEVSKLPDPDFELPPTKARIDESNRTSLLCPEKIAKGEEFEVPEIQLSKQLHAKDEVSVFAICGSDTKESTDRLTTDSIQDDINFHIKVGKSPNFDFELPLEARIEESDQTPLLSQQRTAKETEVSALRAGKEKSGKDQLQYEEMSAEKHVIAFERTSSEKLRTPLLELMKEGEKYVNESAKKNKGRVAKKSAEDGRNSSTKKDMANSPTEREKRKPKCTFFSNCMGCT
ncbi:uncharacterized protein LOC122091114 isoform X2 [Macadamia integrifolia]|uniref:uncharacterized protein LOC122091114 isoform X2 n=1 Tax=Macadamia integrifolia TaxID=60698 RepID=UPI001C4F4223|nr:uncharacterized protein LOC122091114 isoform X2 [Macadamia integrifolia]